MQLKFTNLIWFSKLQGNTFEFLQDQVKKKMYIILPESIWCLTSQLDRQKSVWPWHRTGENGISLCDLPFLQHILELKVKTLGKSTEPVTRSQRKLYLVQIKRSIRMMTMSITQNDIITNRKTISCLYISRAGSLCNMPNQ